MKNLNRKVYALFRTPDMLSVNLGHNILALDKLAAYVRRRVKGIIEGRVI